MKKKEKTLGQIIAEQRSKNDNYYVHVNELVDKIHGDKWPSTLEDALKKGKEAYGRKFYIAVMLKQERLLNEVQHALFIAKKSCPTPTYNQAVYRYDNEGLHFLWTVPDKLVAKQMMKDMLFTPDEEKELLGYVIDFYEGKLDYLCRKENNEELVDGPVPILINIGDKNE